MIKRDRPADGDNEDAEKFFRALKETVINVERLLNAF